jgi:hypothetical protein
MTEQAKKVWKEKGIIVAKDAPVGVHLGINTDKYEYFIKT